MIGLNADMGLDEVEAAANIAGHIENWDDEKVIQEKEEYRLFTDRMRAPLKLTRL
jgi:hypothetical protein